MSTESGSRQTVPNLINQFHDSEQAYRQAKTELIEHLGTLAGSPVYIEGYSSQAVIASAVSPEGEVLRRTIIPTKRLFEKNQTLIELDEARLVGCTNGEVMVALTNIEPPVRQYQRLCYVFKLQDIVCMEPMPELDK